jgi:hypothetical protein
MIKEYQNAMVTEGILNSEQSKNVPFDIICK